MAKAAGVKEHKFVKIMLNQWDGCSLTDEKMDIHDGDINRTTIPTRTFLPGTWYFFPWRPPADALDITDIFIGVSEVDKYVDCREEFIRSMEQTINLGTVLGAEKKQNHPSRSLHAHDQGRRGASGESFRELITASHLDLLRGGKNPAVPAIAAFSGPKHLKRRNKKTRCLIENENGELKMKKPI